MFALKFYTTADVRIKLGIENKTYLDYLMVLTSLTLNLVNLLKFLY